MVPLLPPDTYTLTVTASGFKTTTNTNVTVPAATSTTVNVTLEVGALQQQVTVEAAAEVLQTENAANGATVNQRTVSTLPLTNRNYTQILALSPGVAGEVPNAATLGRNTVNVNVNGSLVSDNSFQMDGQDVSNLQSQGGADTVALGGISIPSPDSIEEFRVQTSQYDASFGRGSGASVDVITKSGTNQFHGDLFEFLRNSDLNANDFFLNRNGQPRPDLKQNQFGGTFGGPIWKDKLFFFTSYQGTRQVIGEGAGSLQSVVLPPLTNNRSAAALGAIFCGQKGQFGGVSVACNGSNINPSRAQLTELQVAQWDVSHPDAASNPEQWAGFFRLQHSFHFQGGPGYGEPGLRIVEQKPNLREIFLVARSGSAKFHVLECAWSKPRRIIREHELQSEIYLDRDSDINQRIERGLPPHLGPDRYAISGSGCSDRTPAALQQSDCADHDDYRERRFWAGMATTASLQTLSNIRCRIRFPGCMARITFAWVVRSNTTSCRSRIQICCAEA